MTANSTGIPDDSIRAAASAKGYADVSIVRQTIQDRPGVLDVGHWFVLSVKRRADEEWELLGRRRTQEELLKLLTA